MTREFLLGTATSSHQVEGDNEANDWWAWEAVPGKIHDGSRSGNACGWWGGKAEEDLALARKSGQNAHRMSIEWSRIQPEMGRWDDRAFDRYEAILREAERLGMARMVTLHHFTLPAWVSKRGSLLWNDFAEHFETYAYECARRLGPHVSLWATFNEPSVLAVQAYAEGDWPPGLGNPFAALRALTALLRAHARGYQALKRGSPNVPAGIVLNAPVFDAWHPNRPLDRLVSWVQDWTVNGDVLRALATGWLFPPLVIVPDLVPGLARSFDFLGLNYYGRYRVEFDLRSPGRFFGKSDRSKSVHTAHNDWGDVYPEGIERQLLRLSKLGVPLYVTENGIMDATDEKRAAFLEAHLRATLRARGRGADVRGYLAWSLVDNFEWAEGYAPKFGMVAVDHATQARTPKPSLRAFGRLMPR